MPPRPPEFEPAPEGDSDGHRDPPSGSAAFPRGYAGRPGWDALCQHAPVPMVVLSDDKPRAGQVLASNRAFRHAFGANAEQSSGGTWHDLFAREQQAEAAAAWELCRRTGCFRGLLHLASPAAGRLLTAEVTLFTFPDAAVRAAILDVLSRASGSERTDGPRAADRAELALDASADGVWDWNLEAGTLYFSARAGSMLGLSRRDLGQTFADWTSRIHPADARLFMKALHDHREGKSPQFAAEHRLRHAAGHWVTVLARGMVIRDARRRPYRMIGAWTDLSAIRAAEREAREHQATLAHVLRVATVNELAGALTHEMHQPLGAIVNFARGCLRRLDAQTLDEGALRQALSTIAEQAERAATISRRSRDFLRKSQPDRRALDLTQLVPEVAALLQSDVAAREAVVTLQLPNVPQMVWADKVQLQQVLINLLQNALDAFAAAQSVTREITLAVAPMAESAKEPGRVRVTVRDTGPGLEEGVQATLFDPFVTTKSAGLGLGLAISRSIAAAHDGELLVESAPGAGAAFHLVLPVHVEPSPRARPAERLAEETRAEAERPEHVASDDPTLSGS